MSARKVAMMTEAGLVDPSPSLLRSNEADEGRVHAVPCSDGRMALFPKQAPNFLHLVWIEFRASMDDLVHRVFNPCGPAKVVGRHTIQMPISARMRRLMFWGRGCPMHFLTNKSGWDLVDPSNSDSQSEGPFYAPVAGIGKQHFFKKLPHLRLPIGARLSRISVSQPFSIVRSTPSKRMSLQDTFRHSALSGFPLMSDVAVARNRPYAIDSHLTPLQVGLVRARRRPASLRRVRFLYLKNSGNATPSHRDIAA